MHTAAPELLFIRDLWVVPPLTSFMESWSEQDI